MGLRDQAYALLQIVQLPVACLNLYFGQLQPLCDLNLFLWKYTLQAVTAHLGQNPPFCRLFDGERSSYKFSIPFQSPILCWIITTVYVYYSFMVPHHRRAASVTRKIGDEVAR